MLDVLKQVRAAFSLLNPEEVRQRAMRSVTIGLVATSDRGYNELEQFFLPASLPAAARESLRATIYRAGDSQVPPKVDLVLYEPGLFVPDGAYHFNRNDPESTVQEILEENDDLSLALARRFLPFRKGVVERTIRAVAKENTLFAVATALPNIMPNLFELPWAFGEFASDTVFLTLNQIRMAFLIAAACGSDVGFSAQKGSVLSIVAAAFGWRTIARELVGKIPLGGGLIPKGAIAFAGTLVVGKGLERFYHSNIPYTSRERDEDYRIALEQGKDTAALLTRNGG